MGSITGHQLQLLLLLLSILRITITITITQLWDLLQLLLLLLPKQFLLQLLLHVLFLRQVRKFNERAFLYVNNVLPISADINTISLCLRPPKVVAGGIMFLV